MVDLAIHAFHLYRASDFPDVLVQENLIRALNILTDPTLGEARQVRLIVFNADSWRSDN